MYHYTVIRYTLNYIQEELAAHNSTFLIPHLKFQTIAVLPVAF